MSGAAETEGEHPTLKPRGFDEAMRMSLNDTTRADRAHIAFFGLRNAGKSSLVNAVTGQSTSIVSPIAGTTTDPVEKSMELLPLGPAVVIDTPGLDDEGALGELRKARTRRILDKTDIAVLTIEDASGLRPEEREIISEFESRNIPYVIARNKCDLSHAASAEAPRPNEIRVSATENIRIDELRALIASLASDIQKPAGLLDGLLKPGESAVLATPIDSSAPKGRLILPQQQTIRAILDIGAYCAVARPDALRAALSIRPALAIADSRVFKEVSDIIPEEIGLTSFSMLFARQKGGLEQSLTGVRKLDSLSSGDSVLIAEGCTHRRQCEDIGTVKIPRLISEYSGKSLNFAYASGGEFPDDLRPYSLIVHCGGCMLNSREMSHRYALASDMGVPVANYGVLIAKITGELERAIRPFGLSLNA